MGKFKILNTSEHEYMLLREPSIKVTGSMATEFYFPWFFLSCQRLKSLHSNDLEYVSYKFCGRTYSGTSDFCKEKIKDYPGYSKKFSGQCTVSAWKDIHGETVVKIEKKIPTFDSGDRAYDSCRELYLFHDKKRTYGIYTKGGYHIVKFYFCENLKIADMRVRACLKEQGFPY